MRALRACENCRDRKKKCDEGQPTCFLCRRGKLTCVYRETPSIDEIPGPHENIMANILLQLENFRKEFTNRMSAVENVIQKYGDPKASQAPSELERQVFQNSSSTYPRESVSLDDGNIILNQSDCGSPPVEDIDSVLNISTESEPATDSISAYSGRFFSSPPSVVASLSPSTSSQTGNTGSLSVEEPQIQSEVSGEAQDLELQAQLTSHDQSEIIGEAQILDLQTQLKSHDEIKFQQSPPIYSPFAAHRLLLWEPAKQALNLTEDDLEGLQAADFVLQVERNRTVLGEFSSSCSTGDCSNTAYQQRPSSSSTISDTPLHSLLAGRAIPNFLPEKFIAPFASSVKRSYLQSYLKHIHPTYPILDPVAVTEIVKNYELATSEGSDIVPFVQQGAAMAPATEALASVCLALGAISEPSSYSLNFRRSPSEISSHCTCSVARNKTSERIPGIAYYSRAIELLNSTSGCQDLEFAQAAILVALYAAQLSCVVESLFWVQRAGMACQTMTSYWKHPLDYAIIPSYYDNLSACAHWACVQLESDLLMELSLPPMNMQKSDSIVQYAFAHSRYHKKSDIYPDDERIFYKFNMRSAMTSLLNRIKTFISEPYEKTKEVSLRVVAELESQLESWKSQLPCNDWSDGSNSSLSTKGFRMEYYNAKCLIYRPYIQAALSNGLCSSELAPDIVHSSIAAGHPYSFTIDLDPIIECVQAMIASIEIWESLCINKLKLVNFVGLAHRHFGYVILLYYLFTNDNVNIPVDVLNHDGIFQLISTMITTFREFAGAPPSLYQDELILSTVLQSLASKVD